MTAMTLKPMAAAVAIENSEIHIEASIVFGSGAKRPRPARERPRFDLVPRRASTEKQLTGGE
jgi:hypothetical protein